MTHSRCEDLGDRLLVVNANGKKRNVLSSQYYATLMEALAQASREARITSVVLHGEGGFFCAGGDLRKLQERHVAPHDDRLAAIEALHDVMRAIARCDKPVIAAVEGGAAGAGVSLAFACDLIVASESALFTVAYVKAGLVPDGGLTYHLTRLLPRGLAMRMALLGEPVPARRLHDFGVVGELAPDGEALACAMKLADRVAAGPSTTQGVIKSLISAACDSELDAQLDRERDAMAVAMASVEAGEGIAAFLERRPADFVRLRTQARYRKDPR